MRAIRVDEHGGADALKRVEIPEPVAGPGEVSVRVTHVGLNHLDVWVRRGVEGHVFPLPLIPGADTWSVAWIVAALAVTRFLVGAANGPLFPVTIGGTEDGAGYALVNGAGSAINVTTNNGPGVSGFEGARIIVGAHGDGEPDERTPTYPHGSSEKGSIATTAKT